MRIAVCGYIVRGPLGGLVWHHLQYVLGLHRLGHDVCFVEDSDDYPSCYDPSRDVTDTDPSYGLAFADRAFDGVGLGDRWAYFDAHTNQWLGPMRTAVLEFCRTADLLLNLSVVTPARPWTGLAPCRVLVDTDPVFTQIRHLTDPRARTHAAQHTAFFSFGENIGSAGCSIPDDGLPWMPTRQPMVLELWPNSPGPAEGAYTTVMQWDSYRALDYGGRSFGVKSASFGPYLDIPSRSGMPLEVAAGSASAPKELLRANGWRLRDPLEVTRTGAAYQQFIRNSKGEFTVAKHGYVVSHSGWFSERSAAYLASARPVITQDTGMGDVLPVGAGLITFASPEAALDALKRVEGDYASQSRAASTLAQEWFASDRVLTSLLQRAT